jgi:hypothetical protein
MKFNLTEGEVKNILEMHSKLKKEEKVISEQITNLANMSGIELANMRRGSKLAFDASYNGLSALQKKIVDDKLAGRLASNTTQTNTGQSTSTNTGKLNDTKTSGPEPTLQEKLQALIDDGCVKNGVVVQMGSTNPNKQYAIKQQSTLNPNKSRYFFIDNTYGTVGADGKFKYGTEKWECNTNRIQSDKEKQAKDKAGSESQKAATDSNIENLKKEGAWKTYDELIATETKENINNPAMYEKKVVDGVTLYRRTSGRGIAGGLDKRQQEVITQFKAKGAKLENEVSELESKAWTRKLVSPKSDGLFSEDLYMYFPPNTITNADITTAFEDAVNDQTPQDSSDCKKSIEAYYMAFKKKKVFTDDVLSAMKEKVQACKNEYYGSWGTFGGGKTIDGYLDMLSGKAPGGPSSYGGDSKWRLK